MRLHKLKQDTLHWITLNGCFLQTQRSAIEELVRQVVLEYYPIVDRGSRADIQYLSTMYPTKGVYNRAGREFVGPQAVEDFYQNERTLQGTHKILTCSVDRLVVSITGAFQGVSLSEGSPRVLEFADCWRFNFDGELAFRHTFLSRGHETTTGRKLAKFLPILQSNNMSNCKFLLAFLFTLLLIGCQGEASSAKTSSGVSNLPRQASQSASLSIEEPLESPRPSLVLELDGPLTSEDSASSQRELQDFLTKGPAAIVGHAEASIIPQNDELDALKRLNLGFSDGGEPIVGFKIKEKSEQAKIADLRSTDPESLGVSGEIDGGKIIPAP